MAHQLEANARFDVQTEPTRFRELTTIANNLWSKGIAWDDEFCCLLLDLLQVVSWQEALARACAELLEGDWVGGLLPNAELTRLWPSQT